MVHDDSGLHFDDLAIGSSFKTTGRTVTEADLVAFVNCTGLTGPLFTNVEFLKTQSAISGRPVPGALAFTWSEAFCASGPMRGTGLALLKVEIDFETAVQVGDTIHCEAEVVELRRSKSRPGAGIVRFRNRVVTQDGVVAITYHATRLIKARPTRHA